MSVLRHAGTYHHGKTQKRHWRWSLPVIVTALGALFLGADTPLKANSVDVLRILSAGGDDVHPNHRSQIPAGPGKSVDIVVDVMNTGTDQAEGYDPEDFIYTAKYHKLGSHEMTVETCDAEQLTADQGCLDVSNFDLTGNGVKFYPPNDMGARIKIFVKARDPNIDTTDFVTLVNSDYESDPRSYEAPVEAVTDVTEYPYATYSNHQALNNLGIWVTIGGEEFFKPYVASSDWAPYTNGYVSYVDGVEVDSGITWVGYDPFSYVTDHYGIWRYHQVYGWVWKEFPTPEYQPFVATMIWTDGYVGWHPYWAAFDAGYALGVEVGFLDGYEAGLRDGWHDGHRDHYWGLTLCPREHFGESNLRDWRIHDETIIRNTYVTIHEGGTFGRRFGGDGIQEHRTFITNLETSSHIKINITNISYKTVKDKRGHEVRLASPQHMAGREIPESVKESARAIAKSRHPIPVGSIVSSDPAHPHDGPKIVPPTTNHRGIADAPRIVGEDGKIVELASNAKKHPAEMNEHSGLPKPVIHPQQPVGAAKPHLPKFDPKPNAPEHKPVKPVGHTPATPPHHTEPATPPHHTEPATPVTPPHHTEPATPPHHTEPATPVTPPHHTEPATPPHHTEPTPAHPPAPHHPKDDNLDE